MAQPVHRLPGRPRKHQYGWEQAIKQVKLPTQSEKEEKICKGKSAIRPIVQKVDGTLLQRYVHLFAICSRQRLLQGITLGFTCASIVPVTILLEIT